jgi:mono/diheme cytochrome c family protein
MLSSTHILSSRRVSRLTAVFAAVAALFVATTARAQAPQFSPGALAWADGACSICHNSIGQGGVTGEAPKGPDLWRTRLTRDQIKETIACGRENTGMPYHVVGAYEKRACYGKPLGAVPNNVDNGAEFTEEQIETLVAFLWDNVVGKGPITKAKCALFFGNNLSNPVCGSLP